MSQAVTAWETHAAPFILPSSTNQLTYTKVVLLCMVQTDNKQASYAWAGQSARSVARRPNITAEQWTAETDRKQQETQDVSAPAGAILLVSTSQRVDDVKPWHPEPRVPVDHRVMTGQRLSPC